MPAKTKTTQPKTPEVFQERDNFFTPRYATELLLPYIKKFTTIWECASGSGRMANVLKENGKRVHSSDINSYDGTIIHNFLTDNSKNFIEDYKIELNVTNVPFSLKFEFIEKSLELDIPFAYLIPFDMCKFLHNKFRDFGLQAIVPERRIDFLTPNIIRRVNDGEALQSVNKEFGLKLKKTSEILPTLKDYVKMTKCYDDNFLNYSKLEEIPYQLLKKYSSSDFHSFWITYKLNLPKDFMFVSLSLEDKKRIL